MAIEFSKILYFREIFIRYYNNDRIKERLGGLARSNAVTIRIENRLCKTKSSKRNAYSIQPDLIGSLYGTNLFQVRMLIYFFSSCFPGKRAPPKRGLQDLRRMPRQHRTFAALSLHCHRSYRPSVGPLPFSS